MVGRRMIMMGISGFTSKKELKEAVGQRPHFIETSIFGQEFRGDGSYVVVGPTPYTRKWYATVTVSDGMIERVR